MEFMPEYYSSNVTQTPHLKPIVKNNSSMTKKVKQSKASSPRKVFYLLKDDQLSSIGEIGETMKTKQRTIGGSIEKNTNDELALGKQNRIRNDLLLLLRQQPQKFQVFNLPETFNCTNKRMGLHRDKSDCAKYYFCNGKAYYAKQKTLQRTMLRKFYSEVHYENLLNSGGSSSEEERQGDEVETSKAYTCPGNTAFNMNGCFCDPGEFKNRCQYLSETFCDFASIKEPRFRIVK
jgi:hypothetical protein